ncbi:hypothetical protein SCUCBS95973_003222 [Sporothrix curviconia]|uniref:Uncharacterized protein n=1 Tax=Sporothrix curviconia TaxID=1260050 RepID=A0ABP0BDF2_9PEZI
MPPLHKWQAGLLLESVAIEHGVLTMGLLKRDDDPNDVGCHGWGCYTGAEKSGIIFMSIIVPMVLFFIFWFLITRPMDDLSIDSDLSETEQRQTHPPLETAQPAQPQVQQLPQESQPAAQPAAQPTRRSGLLQEELQSKSRATSKCSHHLGSSKQINHTGRRLRRILSSSLNLDQHSRYRSLPSRKVCQVKHPGIQFMSRHLSS